jgi:hypothetical protein
MKVFAQGGPQDFVLCLGCRSQMIKEYFLNFEAMANPQSESSGRTNVLSLDLLGGSKSRGWHHGDACPSSYDRGRVTV